MKKKQGVTLMKSKPKLGFEKKNFGSPKGIGILAPIVIVKGKK